MKSLDCLRKENSALVIVDLQKGYCDPTSDCSQQLGWDVRGADKVAHKHTSFLEDIRKILPSDKIIWLHMDESPETYAPNLHYGPHSEEFYTLCVRGTEGHQFHVVHPEDGEVDFIKFHPSGFSNPDLDKYLKEKGITQLCFTGVISSRCVNATLITASALGYDCLLIEDLVTEPAHLKEEADIHKNVTSMFFAVSCNSDELIKRLNTQ